MLYTRDLNGRITTIKDTIGRTMHYANGNRTRNTDPDGHFTDYTVDSKWNTIADPLGNVVTLDYSPEGGLASIKDPLGNTTTLIRNLAGRVTQETDPLGFSSQKTLSPIDHVTQVADSMGGKTQINYRADRNLGSVVNPLGNTVESYDYDLAARLTKKTDAQGKVSSFAYNVAGRLASATDRKGQVSTLVHDAGGRVTQGNLPSGVTIYFTYDAVGRLIALEEKSGASPSRSEYGYDNRDLLTQETIHQQGGSHVITYQYDALGRRITRNLDSVDTTAYGYDKAGRVTSIISFSPIYRTHRPRKCCKLGYDKAITLDNAPRKVSGIAPIMDRRLHNASII